MSNGDYAPLNQQIVATVDFTKAAVLDTAVQEGQSIAYQKVAQAAAFAVQDATDYLRNVQTIATAAQGVALSLMIETKDPFYASVLTEAQKAVTAAQTNFAAVGTAASGVVKDFGSA